MSDDELLTSGDAARLAVKHPDTIRAWHKAGLLPAVRTASGLLLFKKRDVERVAKARRKERAGAAA